MSSGSACCYSRAACAPAERAIVPEAGAWLTSPSRPSGGGKGRGATDRAWRAASGRPPVSPPGRAACWAVLGRTRRTGSAPGELTNGPPPPPLGVRHLLHTAIGVGDWDRHREMAPVLVRFVVCGYQSERIQPPLCRAYSAGLGRCAAMIQNWTGRVKRENNVRYCVQQHSAWLRIANLLTSGPTT